MTVQSQNPVTSSAAQAEQAASQKTAASTTPSIDGLATENTFLQLLVAQIKNQDPTNPTDSVQFLTQLAQFSQLEQLIGIRQELQSPSSPTDSSKQNSGADGSTGTNKTTN